MYSIYALYIKKPPGPPGAMAQWSFEIMNCHLTRRLRRFCTDFDGSGTKSFGIWPRTKRATPRAIRMRETPYFNFLP